MLKALHFWQTKKKLSLFILLTCLVLFSGFLRIYKVNEYPVSIYWDGAASSYNAYSILKTGKDEYGNVMPLLFRSFDDYKMPANIYVTAFFIWIFGLNEFSTRVSSGLAGTISVLFAFFLVRELLLLIPLQKNKHALLQQFLDHKNEVSLLTAFFLAISPWAIQFSRTEFEANVGAVFIIIGATCFLRAIRLKKLLFFLLSSISFALSVYFYRSIIVFTPLLVGSFILIFWKNLLQQKRNIFLFGIVLVVLAVPMYRAITTKEGMIRSNQVSVFTNDEDQRIKLSLLNQKAGNTIISRIIYNRRIIDGEILLSNYFSQFSPDFLFFRGDVNTGRHGARNMGLLYLWEIPFVLIGFFFLLRKIPYPSKYVILSWLLLAPIPAAVSVPNPHALRGLNILPIPQLITALGVGVVFFLLHKKWRIIFSFIMAIAISIFFILYQNNYYTYTAKVTSADWADGYKQLLQYTFPRENNYQKIVISGHYWKPYVYVLYYKHYDPATYQKTGSEWGFDKYVFGGTRWGQGEYELGNVNLKSWAHANKLLVALSPDEYVTQKQNLHELTRIYNHNNELVFIVGETQ